MNTDLYISLIYKQLKGTILPEELKTLQEWESASDENRTIANQTRNVWEETEQYDIPFELDHKADFAKVKAAIKTPAKATPIVKMQSRRRWLNVAAAVIFICGAGFLLRDYFQTDIAWTTVVAQSDIKEIQLEDGSKVWLNKGTTIKYPTTFSGKNRPIKLEGEAFFEVAKNAEKPFQVFTEKTTVTVLGTQFNVRAKKNEPTTEVAVKEGKVRFEQIDKSENLILTANDKGIFTHKDQRLKKVVDRDLNDLAWQRKSLRFSSSTLSAAIDVIAKKYEVKIEIQDAEMKKCAVGGRYNSETTVENLIKNITSTFKMTVKKIDNTYYLQGGSCPSKN